MGTVIQEEGLRRLRSLPLRAIAAFAARWGLRMEGSLDRLSLRDQDSARGLIRVVVTVACGGLVTGRLDVARAASRFDLIALRWYFPSVWHRTRMRWALLRGHEGRFSASLAALDDATAYCNLVGAAAKLGRAALAAEVFVESADRAEDFDENLASIKTELIESALTAAAAVADVAGVERARAAAVSDLDRLSGLGPSMTDWLGFPIDPTSGGLFGPLWPDASSPW